jgi:hypothetical protein
LIIHDCSPGMRHHVVRMGDWDKRYNWAVEVHKEDQHERFYKLSSGTTSLKFQKGVWYHVTFIRSQDGICLFVDGVRVDRMEAPLTNAGNDLPPKVSYEILAAFFY